MKSGWNWDKIGMKSGQKSSKDKEIGKQGKRHKNKNNRKGG